MRNYTRFAALAALPIAALTLTACSSGEADLDLQAGWDRLMLQNSASAVNTELDFLTGELVSSAEEGGTGLSLKSTSDSGSGELEAAIAESEQRECESYVDPIGDALSSQGFDISMLLYYTVWAASSSAVSDEYVDASRAVGAWVEENQGEIENLEVGSARYNEIVVERAAEQEEHWNDVYPELTAEREQVRAMEADARTRSRTSQMVREAQDFYIRVCGIEVPDDYVFPTPEELEIAVDQAYLDSTNPDN
ncbi:hypothetical protein [Demequina aurantiaca]|uniref:hypothetical protein n=1 Tax=Demequina aurantiaca TaxID=676200 RepID=UPI003D3543AF